MPSPRRLLLFSGTAAAWRLPRRDARHAAVARARVARLQILAEQSPIWRVGGRAVTIERLMRCVLEEVERR
jgi:hypothetical protein